MEFETMAQVFGDNGGSVYEVVPSWTADQQRAAWFGGQQQIPMMQVAPQVAAARGYANAGAEAAGRNVQVPNAAGAPNAAQQSSGNANLTTPGQSNSMIAPAQAGPAMMQMPQSSGQMLRSNVPAQSQQALQPGMNVANFSQNGFQITMPNGNPLTQGAANAGVLPNAGMAKNSFDVKFDKGDFDPATGQMKLDFSKYGGSTFTGTFAEMQKMGGSGLAKLFGNFQNGTPQPTYANAAAGAEAAANRAGSVAPKPAPGMPMPPKRPADAAPTAAPAAAQPAPASAPATATSGAPAAPGATPAPASGGTGTTPQKQSAAPDTGAQQHAGIMNAQQYLAELQSPQLAQALRMLALG